MADQASPVLQAHGLSKSFGSGQQRVLALDDVSLAIRPGVVTGLIGPDGAGKTTLMRLAAGLLTPDHGQIHALGLDATRESLAVQAMLGYMPQRFGLYEDLSAQENLDLYADLQGVPHELRQQRYDALMHMTGLQPFLKRLAGNMSGGMKQKLGLACTLVRPPRLLLLDEPTVGVDPVSRRELWSIVDRLVATQGMSVLLSTAYLDEAERCHEVILMHHGRVLEQGPPQRIRARMNGRTWTLSVPGQHPRDLQMMLMQAPGVVDALVQGSHIRLVSAQTEWPAALTELPALRQAVVTAVPPRFEDGFIDLLRALETRAQPQPATATMQPSGTDTAPDNIIEVEKLVRCFGDFRAVDGVSFAVRRGEIFGLLGANGAGKSTTFRILCGLLTASSGHVQVAGHDLRRAAAQARQRIGYMSQKFSLYGNLSVAQNLNFFARVYGLSGTRCAQRLAWATDTFGLHPYQNQSAANLPLGYKQRLSMACALIRPRV